MNFKRLVLLAFATATSWLVGAQSIQSTYSNAGIGELLFEGMPHNFAMGETGIGIIAPWHINLQNPALMGYNFNSLSSFQTGLSADFRSFENNIDSYTSNTGSLRYLAMSFPVVKNRWTSGFALLPKTFSNYNTFSTDTLSAGVHTISQSQGEGGLTQFAWANGIHLFKGFNLGFKASYVFGAINKYSNIRFEGDSVSSSYIISNDQKTHYGDILLSVGASFRQKLATNHYLNLGAVYDVSGEIKGTRNETESRLFLDRTPFSSKELATDVTVLEKLPQSAGVGFSYEYINRFKIGADFSKQRWTDVAEGGTNSVRDIKIISVGSEIVPDYQSVNSYLKRVIYRVGFSYRELPYMVSNTAINDFGINFGASFPVSGYSSLDIALKAGQRGTTSNNLIKEKYFHIVLGATINDRWFRPYRYD